MKTPGFWTNLIRSGAFVAVAGMFFGMSFILTSRITLQSGDERSGEPRRANTYVPAFREQSGWEMVMVFFASGSCPASAAPELPGLVEGAKLALSGEARRRGMGFAAVGSGIDPSVRDAVENLSRFGEFDELILGRGWTNSAALEFIFQNVKGEAAVPQIAVLRRRVEGAPGVRRSVSSVQLLARKVGPIELWAWANLGFPIPQPDT